jgi:hypothetical protein
MRQSTPFKSAVPSTRLLLSLVVEFILSALAPLDRAGECAQSSESNPFVDPCSLRVLLYIQRTTLRVWRLNSHDASLPREYNS